MTFNHNHTPDNDLNVPEVEIVLQNNTNTSHCEEDIDLDLDLGLKDDDVPHDDSEVGEDEDRRSFNNQASCLLNKRNLTAAALLGLCVVGFSTTTTLAVTSRSAAAMQPSEPPNNTKSSKSSKTPKAKVSKTPKSAKNTASKTSKSADVNTSPSPSEQPSTSSAPSSCVGPGARDKDIKNKNVLLSANGMLRTPSGLPSSEQPSKSSAPSPSSYCGARDKDIKNLLLSANVSGSDAINDESSSQGKAFFWLTCEDSINPPLQPGIDDAQIIQRYILAVFYYSFNGNRWRNNSGWLGGSNECDWYRVGCDTTSGVVGGFHCHVLVLAEPQGCVPLVLVVILIVIV